MLTSTIYKKQTFTPRKRRINDNLEQQAQALFKSWFVDFEPFKDGEFVDSELGMIPKGWRVACLGEITKECKERVGNRQDVRVLSPVTTGELLLSEEYFTKQIFSDNISKYIIVKPDEMDDAKSASLARNVRKEIEDKMDYPGNIKVTVIRENRYVEYAK